MSWGRPLLSELRSAPKPRAACRFLEQRVIGFGCPRRCLTLISPLYTSVRFVDANSGVYVFDVGTYVC